MRSALLVPASLAALCVLASCASSKGAPPTVVCGKTISRSPAGMVVDDATGPDITVTAVTVDDVIALRVAKGCHSGATIGVEPEDAASVVDSVRASDGHYTVVLLQPRRGSFTVRVTRSPTSVTAVTVQGLVLPASAKPS